MPNLEVLLTKAYRTNRKRDADDRASGFASPTTGQIWQLLRTAESAVECGIATEDWNAVAEGLVMVKQAWPRVQALELPF